MYKRQTVLFAHTFSNDRVTAKINLFKVDKETGKAVPQGDATLKGAVYGLYAREDIVHPDGATGTIYKAGEQVASLTTDDKGQASVKGLYLGKFYVKEITSPTGYLADTEEHDLVCSYEGDMTAEVKRECTSSEQVIKPVSYTHLDVYKRQVQYTSINSPYWQSHFYGFGRW